MTPAAPLGRLFLRLTLYYGFLGALAWAALTFFPGLSALLGRFRAYSALGALGAGRGGRGLEGMGAALPVLSGADWALLTTVCMATAVAVGLPVSWVYMATKRRTGYDQSVVQTIIILPMVVAGTVILVQNSLALAFALAAIVAAVRFRNTLKDTKDAVYIFLALAVGVAAGVSAIAVAAVLSALFNAVVLLLWWFDVGAGAEPLERPKGPRPSRSEAL